MNKLLRHIILLLAALPFAAFAQDYEDSQADLRENPVLDSYELIDEPSLADYADIYKKYPFLNLEANHIVLNGADWSRLNSLFDAAGDTLINILHIGDSHIQAEGSTTRTRLLMQSRYGSAGRGLVIPFRLAGTNQPNDYTITSPSAFTSAKLMKQPWPVDMGFSGIALEPNSRTFSFTISTKMVNNIDPSFDRIRIFCCGSLPKVSAVRGSSGKSVPFDTETQPGIVDLMIDDEMTEATIDFQSNGTCSILAFDLDNSTAGVKYSAIGNNGATYSSYNNIGSLGRDLAAFSPDLVIISLGTNEAFGKVSDEVMRSSIDVMVSTIRRANPHAAILLCTPADCQRSVTTRTTTGKGKRRRTRRTKTYRHNENIQRLRDVILQYGRDKHIATWDWFEVAGGANSSDAWLENSLMSKDHIHLTHAGYILSGDLLYDALTK